MRLTGRLRRVEAAAVRLGLLPGPGCPACRDRRGLSVLVSGRWTAGGAAVAEEPGPPPCPACGEVPEVVVLVVEEVVPAGPPEDDACPPTPQG